MNTSTILLAVLAVSVASAFPLAGEAFAQTTTDNAPPTVITADTKITAENKATIVFNESLRSSSTGAFSTGTLTAGTIIGNDKAFDALSPTERAFNVIGAKRATTNVPNDTLILTFNKKLNTDATADIQANFRLADLANNVFAGTSPNDLAATAQISLTDGQAPKVKSAKIIDPATSGVDTTNKQIEIVFTEALSGSTSSSSELSTASFTDFKLTKGKDLTNLPVSKALAVAAGTEPSTGTVMLTILGGGAPTIPGTGVPIDAEGTVNIQTIFGADGAPTSLSDTEGNAFVSKTAYPIMAGQIPSIESAKITGPNQVTIQFSEDMETVSAANFLDFKLTMGKDLTNLPVSKSLTASLGSDVSNVILTIVDGNMPTDATATVNIVSTFDADGKATSLHDTADIPPSQDIAYKITDGQPPTVQSANVTGPNQITVEFSEKVQPMRGAFTKFEHTSGNLVNGTAFDYIGVNSTRIIDNAYSIINNTVVLGISGPPLGTNAAGTIDIVPAKIMDLAKDKDGKSAPNLLNLDSPTEYTVTIGQYPTIVSAKITGPLRIAIEFSENVSVTGNPFTIEVGNKKMAFASAASPGAEDISVSGNTITLNLSGVEIRETQSATLSITNTATASVVSTTSPPIQVPDVADYRVEPGQTPSIESAKLVPLTVDGNEAKNWIKIEFSEPVYAAMGHFTNFKLTAGTGVTGETRSIDSILPKLTKPAEFINLSNGTVNISDVILLGIGGDKLPTDAAGTLRIGNYTSTVVQHQILDADETALPRATRAIEDGQPPTLMEGYPKITGPTTLTVKFSEVVTASATDFAALKLSNVDTTNTDRNIIDINPKAPSNTFKLTVNGAMPANAQGTMTITSPTRITNGVSETTSLFDSSGNYLSDAGTGIVVSAGQTPALADGYPKITAPREVTIKFTVPVNASLDAFTNFKINNEDGARSFAHFNGNGNDTITLGGVNGSAIPADAHGTIDISSAITSVESGAAFPGKLGAAVKPGQAPKIMSANFTAADTVAMAFSDLVDPDSGKFTLTVDGESAPRDGGEPTLNGEIVELRFNADDHEPFAPDATGTIEIRDIENEITKVKIATVTQVVRDAQAPTLVDNEGKVTDGNTVTLKFDEPVMAEQSHFGTLMVGPTGSFETRAITDIDVSGKTVILQVAAPDFADDAQGSLKILDGITDIAGNPLARLVDPITLAAGQVPEIMDDYPKITGPNQITIKFTEPVNATVSDFTKLLITYDPDGTGDLIPVSGEERNISKVDGSGTDTIVLTVSGAAFVKGTTGSIDISGSITDQTGNNLVAEPNRPVTADVEPKIESFEITGPKTLTIKFTEPVRATPSDFTGIVAKYTIAGTAIETPGNIIGADPLGKLSDTFTLAVSIAVDMPTNATGTITIRSNVLTPASDGNPEIRTMTDSSGNLLQELLDVDPDDNQATPHYGPIPYTLADGQEDIVPTTPTLKSAMITSSDTVTITFSEAVSVKADGSEFTFTLTGETTPRSVNATGTGTDTITLTVDGVDMAHDATGMLDITGTVMSTANNIALAPVNNEDVMDGQAPEIMAGYPKITASDTITVMFTEPVIAVDNHFNFTVSSESDPRDIENANSGSAIITLTVAGTDMPTNATGTINISGMVTDIPGNAFAGVTDMTVADGQAPALMEGYPKITASKIVTVMFTENVTAMASHFADFMVSGEPTTRSITNATGSGSAIITLTVAGTDMPTNATGTINISMVKDSADNMFEGTGITVSDGQDDIPVVGLSGNVTIGLLLSNATDFAEQGEETIEAAERAVADFNKWLRDAGEGWQLVAEYNDTKLDPQTALSLIKELKNDTGVIVGVPTSASVNATKNFINENDMVLISCCSTSPALAISGDNIFRMVPDDSGQAPLLAKQIKITHEKIVIIYRDDAWGEPLNKALVASFGEDGVVQSIPYNASATHTAEFFADTVTSATAAVATVDSDTPVGIVFLGWSETANFMAASSDTALENLTWFGSGDSVNDGEIVRDNLDEFATKTKFSAVQFAPIETNATKKVTAHINNELDRDPAVYAYSTYDAIWVAGHAIDAAQSTDGAKVKAEISKVAMARTMGAMGPNELNENGDLAASNYVLWQVEDNMWKNKGPIANSTIMGTVFIDTNGNNVQDDDEKGYPGYTMHTVDGDLIRKATTDENGMYKFENVRSAPVMTTVQTGFFPSGHTVQNTATSWWEAVMPAENGTAEFDVGFYPVPSAKRVTLNVTVYVDANENGQFDSGEGIGGLDDFYVYEYTIGPRSTISFDTNGMGTVSDIVPADFALFTFVDNNNVQIALRDAGYYWAGTLYTSEDSPDSVVNAELALADDPKPGSTHTVHVRLAPLP